MPRLRRGRDTQGDRLPSWSAPVLVAQVWMKHSEDGNEEPVSSLARRGTTLRRRT